MGEWLAAFGGFFADQVAFTSIARWVAVLYAQLRLEPPETRRAQTLVPLILLHSGPWTIGLLIFGGIKLAGLPESPWRPWFASGFALGLGLMCVVLLMAWRKMVVRKGASA
jgi:hypothetical protein